MEFQSALAGTMAALQLVKGAVAARDDAKVQAALIQVQDKLLDMSIASLGLTERVRSVQTALEEAKRENAELKAKLDERAMYALHEIEPGKFCYRSKPVGESPEPTHHLCQICFDKGIKSILQLESGHEWMSPNMHCLADPKHTLELTRK
jgi:hypothetical protein